MIEARGRRYCERCEIGSIFQNKLLKSLICCEFIVAVVLCFGTRDFSPLVDRMSYKRVRATQITDFQYESWLWKPTKCWNSVSLLVSQDHPTSLFWIILEQKSQTQFIYHPWINDLFLWLWLVKTSFWAYQFPVHKERRTAWHLELSSQTQMKINSPELLQIVQTYHH